MANDYPSILSIIFIKYGTTYSVLFFTIYLLINQKYLFTSN
ncbi:Uncharacterised protein [Yersinia frederiksenii]|nr:Uncharacterised protein [Yersinia frederiksenii]CNK30318.1 Uncharacterised protein [Yersinia frederiksenii]